MSHPPLAVQLHADLEDMKFRDMSGLQKIVYVGKVLVFLCTSGFVYPRIISG